MFLADTLDLGLFSPL
uniref:Uncharacterized protein n=1 Tax=Anguilla anguilla TaxID=7936 RepID=A0A0E9S4E2_ANGAN